MQQLINKKIFIFFIIILSISCYCSRLFTAEAVLLEGAEKGIQEGLTTGLGKTAGVGAETLKSVVDTTMEHLNANLGADVVKSLPTSFFTDLGENLSKLEEIGNIDITSLPKETFENIVKESIESTGLKTGFSEDAIAALKQVKDFKIPENIEQYRATNLGGLELKTHLGIGDVFGKEAPAFHEYNVANRKLLLAREGGNKEAIVQAEENLKGASAKLEEKQAGFSEAEKKAKQRVVELHEKLGQPNLSQGERLEINNNLGKELENLRNVQLEEKVGKQQLLRDKVLQRRENYLTSRERIKSLESDLKIVEDDIKAGKKAGKKAGTEAGNIHNLEAEQTRLKTQIKNATDITREIKGLYHNDFIAAEQAGVMKVADRANFVRDLATTSNAAQKVFSIFKGGASLIVVGLVFSLGSYITGSIEQALGLKARADTLKKPQRFGDIWMQIPSGLLTGSDKPAPDVSYYVYVGLDASPQDNNVSRSSHANTNAYLEKASIFIPSAKYDEWGRTAITDPRFPGTMVNANTGYQFVSGGQGVAGQEVIPFFAQGDKGEISLQAKLNELSGYIEKCVQSKQVIEYRAVNAGCEGEPVLGKRFDEDNNKAHVQKLYPAFAQEGKSWGSILNDAIEGLSRGTFYQNMRIRPFKALDSNMMKEIGMQNAPIDKPYFALGIYVYETPDSPNAKSARTIMQKNNASIADKIVEYVVMVDDENNIVPLQAPMRSGPYNFPSYQLNPKARKILSLFDGNFYQEGKAIPSKLDIDKLIGNYFSTGHEQIAAMKAYVLEKLKYGPFLIGDVSLTIDKKAQDAGIPVYKLAKKLEDGSDDYVIATQSMQAITLPGAPTNFVSLVTSRIYDSNLIPYDKMHGGKKDVGYTIYKQSDTQAPLVVVGPKQDSFGTSISVGLQAPLYSLFMESDLNPSTIDQKSITKDADAKWLAGKIGKLKDDVVQWPLPIPMQTQWALGDRGPIIGSSSAEKQRIGQVIAEKLPQLKNEINKVYTSWKKYMLGKSSEDVQRELGIFPWSSTALRTINIRATSAEDVKKGSYIYTSPYYPGQYLVLAENKEGTQGLAKAFDVANPQPYLISLSTGNVYDKATGESVDKVDNMNLLLNRVQQVQRINADLERKIKATQVGATTEENKQYGAATQFGKFQFYLFKQDLDRGQFVYADVTNIENPVQKAQKGTLLNEVKNFYVTIQLKDEKGNAGDAHNWVFGKQIGAKTYMVLNLTNGTLYARDGIYQGYFKPFSHSVDNNIDIIQGYIDLVFGTLKTTWQIENKQPELRSDLKARIIKLTQDYYNLTLKQKAEIEKAQQIEQKNNQPMDKNLLANIKSQPLVDRLEKLGRYVKKYGDKYYAVDPNGNVITDFNVGNPKKDNNFGITYDNDGKQVTQLTDWILQSARAYNGIYINPDGKQELDMIMDHPAIPMNDMIKLDLQEAQMKLSQARSDLHDIREKYIKNPGDAVIQKQYVTAGFMLNIAQKLFKSAKNTEDITETNFYYNTTLNKYFAQSTKLDGYFDLMIGNEFNKDGSVRLSQHPMLRNENNQVLFTGFNDTGGFIAILQTKQGFIPLLMLQQVSDEKQPTLMKYNMNDIDGNQYYIAHDTDKATYEITRIDEKNKQIKIGNFKPYPSLYYSQLEYIQTDGVYNEEDAHNLNPVYIVGDSLFNNIKQIFYKNNLINVSKQGNNYTGTYKQNNTMKSITYTRKEIKHGKHVTGHYISIKNGASTYDFTFIPALLGISPITVCSTEKELKYLNHLKECTWGINELVDVYGINTLVKALPKRLPAPPKSDIDRVMQQAGNRTAIAQDNVNMINYDATYNRYVYQLSNRDNEWPYYSPEYDGWYVDIQNGILYNDKTPSQGGAYPQATLLMSQLFILLDRLELAVSPIGESKGVPIYGLVYRSSMVIDREGKILNQQIYDLAKNE